MVRDSATLLRAIQRVTSGPAGPELALLASSALACSSALWVSAICKQQAALSAV